MSCQETIDDGANSEQAYIHAWGFNGRGQFGDNTIIDQPFAIK